jgi:hypothetical protein
LKGEVPRVSSKSSTEAPPKRGWGGCEKIKKGGAAAASAHCDSARPAKRAPAPALATACSGAAAHVPLAAAAAARSTTPSAPSVSTYSERSVAESSTSTTALPLAALAALSRKGPKAAAPGAAREAATTPTPRTAR